MWIWGVTQREGADKYRFVRVDDEGRLVISSIADGVSIADGQSIGVSLNNSAQMDAFGRLRVSEPETLLQAKLNLSNQPLFWEEATTGSATATHLPNEASVRLRCTTASGDKVIRQSKQYVPYQPGKSQQILVTFIMGAAKANVSKSVGYFDASNGIFLKQTGSALSIVRRTYVTGSAVDTAVGQSSWNLDPLDGSGDSGITLDMSKSQILFIDLEWLGVGRVRVGFVIDGCIYYAHEFLNTNNLSTVYMSTGSLPVRYEIENTAETASTTDLYAVCASVNSEGGQQIRAPVFSVGNGATLRTVANALLPILSIRVGTVFPGGGSTANRSLVIPVGSAIYSEDAAVYFQLILNGTLTDASWQNFSTTVSGVQYDVSATAITGGTVIDAGYAVSTTQSRQAVVNPIESNLGMTLNLAGSAGDILSLAAIRVTNTSSDCGGVLQWKEIY